MSVTIKDIAKKVGVSHTTVSRALNGSSLINEKTRLRIIDAANELNYVPNYSAKNLVLDRSHNIGLFFTSINEGTSPVFLYDVIKGVTEVIDNKYNLIVKGVNSLKDTNLVAKNNYDGIILMSQSSSDDKFINSIIQKNIPIVVLNREFRHSKICNIVCNDKEGAYKIVKYLIDLGHKDIAIIEGKYGFKSSEERTQGYYEALNANNIKVKEKYIKQGRYDVESGYESMKSLLRLDDPPTAVFCCNDDMALGAYRAIFEENNKKEISIVGFDNNVFSEYITPSLTTVKKPIEKVSREGAKVLLQMISEKSIKTNTIYVETELIVRKSANKLRL